MAACLRHDNNAGGLGLTGGGNRRRTQERHRGVRVRVVALGVLAAMTFGARAASAPVAAMADDRLPVMRARDRAMLERLGGRLVASRGAWLQATTTDCGVAVVREALRGLPRLTVPSHDSVARLADMGVAGTTLDGLARALGALGATVKWSDDLLLADGGTQYIAHLRARHFVLVRKHSSDMVWLFDPLVGEVRIGVREFRGLWSGAGLAVLDQAGLAWGRGRTSAVADEDHSTEG